MINEPSTAKNQTSTTICCLASAGRRLLIMNRQPIITNHRQIIINHHHSPSIINQSTTVTSIISQASLPPQLYSSPWCRSVSIARIACTAPWLYVAGKAPSGSVLMADGVHNGNDATIPRLRRRNRGEASCALQKMVGREPSTTTWSHRSPCAESLASNFASFFLSLSFSA